MRRFLSNALPIGGASVGGIYESIAKISFTIDVNYIINIVIGAIIGGTVGYFLKLLYDRVCWKLKDKIKHLGDCDGK